METVEWLVHQRRELHRSKLRDLAIEDDLLSKLAIADAAASSEIKDEETKLREFREHLQSSREEHVALSSDLGHVRTALGELQQRLQSVTSLREKSESNMKTTEKEFGRLEVADQQKAAEEASIESECLAFEELTKMRLQKINDTDLQFVFTHIDEEDVDLEFVFSFRPERNGMKVFDIDPPISNLELLVTELNKTNDFGPFVRAVRQTWCDQVADQKAKS